MSAPTFLPRTGGVTFVPRTGEQGSAIAGRPSVALCRAWSDFNL
jgi:hypothetical protein